MIKTKNFMLRKPRTTDVNSLWKNYNDKEVMKSMVYMENEKEFKKDFKEMVKSEKKIKGIYKTLVIEVDKNAVGTISAGQRDEKNKKKLTISYWIGKDYRNKGLMSKVIKEFTKYLFKKYNLNRIEAYVRKHNKKSLRVLEKNKFKTEGLLRKNNLIRNKPVDDYILSIVK